HCCSVPACPIVRGLPPYRKPKVVPCTCSLGALSVDGRSHSPSVAPALATWAGTMSVECRLELCAESTAPSSTCAQLQSTWILTMLVRTAGEGAHAGGSKSRISPGGPIQTQTNPPASRPGQG